MFWMLISCRFLFNIMIASLSFSCTHISVQNLCSDSIVTDNIDNDAGQQKALLMLMGALLYTSRSAARVFCPGDHVLRTILAIRAELSCLWTCLGGSGEDRCG